MGRFSPTVLPEPIYLGDVLREGVEGFLGGRQRKEDRRRTKRQEEREDRDENLYLRQLRERDLAQPGARDLGEHLGDPGAAQLTPGTLAQVGRADQPTVPLAFERPEPTKIKVPGGESFSFQERAPYTTASGVVIDPQAARQERTLGTALDEQMSRRFEKPPETAKERNLRIEGEARAQLTGGRRTPDQLTEDVDYAGRIATARRAPTTTEEPEPPKSIELVERQIDDAREEVELAYSISARRPEVVPGGEIDPVLQAAFDVGQQRVEAAQARLDSLNVVRDRLVGGFLNPEEEKVEPGQPTGRRGVPYRRGAGPLREFENVPGQQSRGIFPRIQGAVRPSRLDVTVEPAAAIPAAPAPAPDLTLSERQQKAADEWDELVEKGTDPDEATKLLREKYRLPGVE